MAECLISQAFPPLSDHAHSLPARYVHHTTYLSVHSYHYTMLGHNLDLNIMTPINSSPFKSCLLLQHVSHKHQTTSHFRAYSALCKTPTGHCGTKCAFSAVDNRSRCTCTDSTHTLSIILPYITLTSTSFACTTCHMHALPSHTPQPTTANVLHRTPEGTPIGLVHTHLVTGSWVQVVLFNYTLHHISMAELSCIVDHVVSIIIRAVEQ